MRRVLAIAPLAGLIAVFAPASAGWTQNAEPAWSTGAAAHLPATQADNGPSSSDSPLARTRRIASGIGFQSVSSNDRQEAYPT